MKKLILVSAFSFFVITSLSQTVSMADKYSKKIGNIRFSTSTLNFGKVFTNETRNDTIWLMNAGKEIIKIKIETKEKFIKTNVSSAQLEAGAEGWLSVSYDVGNRNDLGFVLDRIDLITTDKEFPIKNLNITATISDFFSNTNDSLVPKVVLSERSFNYGTIHQGEKASHDFIIKNEGLQPLLIRKAKSTCGCIKISILKNEVLSGESTSIKIEFDSFGKEGKDSSFVSVFFNDPKTPEVKLEICGVIGK